VLQELQVLQVKQVLQEQWEIQAQQALQVHKVLPENLAVQRLTTSLIMAPLTQPLLAMEYLG
jgi:hypothetical protein